MTKYYSNSMGKFAIDCNVQHRSNAKLTKCELWKFRTCDSLTRISNNTNHLTTSPINSSPIASRNSNGWPASSGKLRPLGQSAVFETRLPKLKPASTTVNNGNALLHNGPKISEQQHSFYDNVTDQSEESRGGLALFNGGKQSSSCAETSGARDAR